LAFTGDGIRFCSFFSRNESKDMTMIRASLLPGGVFVPTPLIFHPELTPAMLVTWIQLRSLAGEDSFMAPVSLSQLAARLGIHPSRLNKHMARLREISALSWSAVGPEKIIISFPKKIGVRQEDLVTIPGRLSTSISNPPQLAKEPQPSYFPARILGYLSYDDDEHDPLQLEGEIDDRQRTHAHQPLDLPRLVICQPGETVFASK
jgi:hypothetical protein